MKDSKSSSLDNPTCRQEVKSQRVIAKLNEGGVRVEEEEEGGQRDMSETKTIEENGTGGGAERDGNKEEKVKIGKKMDDMLEMIKNARSGMEDIKMAIKEVDTSKERMINLPRDPHARKENMSQNWILEQANPCTSNIRNTRDITKRRK